MLSHVAVCAPMVDCNRQMQQTGIGWSPQDGVLITRHLLDEGFGLFLSPIHDQRQTHSNATNDL